MIPQRRLKKRVVLLTDCLADLAGGAEKQIFELAKGLDKNNFEVFIVSLDCYGQAPHQLIESTGSHLHIFRVVRIYGISGLVQGLRFKSFLKEQRIDVLMTYHFSSDIWGTFWGKLAGVKTIISNRRDLGFWRNGLHVAAYKLMNHWVNIIVTNSDSIKAMVVKEEGVSLERIEVIYNGVDLNEAISLKNDELRHQLGIKSNDCVIMHVANLKPIKGHRYLLEAFADLVQQCPDLILVLIGKDELDGQLQEMAQRLNILDRVKFLGKRDDVQNILSWADICVLPSLSEGMSNAILEYMAAGKPVIASLVGGNPEMIKNEFNGLLVERENVQQLKDALFNLINDRQKRLDMGFYGYERVKNEFSMPAMVLGYTRLFSRIKVLHLISSGGLYGAERVVLNLVAKSEKGASFVGAINNLHNPHIEIVDEARNLNLSTVIFDSKGKFDFGTIGSIKEFIFTHKIDIVHTHNYKSNFIGIFLAILTKAKWIATHHGWVGSDNKLKLYERIDSFILKHVSKIILVSSKMKGIFMRKRILEERLQVINNGIPIERFESQIQRQIIRLSWGIGSEVRLIVIVGRLSPEKGHEVFLKAAAEVMKNVKNVKFIIVGDGPLWDELQRKASELNLLDDLIFTGIRQDMPAVYSACDILINSSYSEGLPMTILEAMASRLAVIATDVGAVGEVIQTEENGILIPAGDHHLLALKTIELLMNPEKCQRLAKKAYKDVCLRFSDTGMALKYRQVYEEVLHG